MKKLIITIAGLALIASACGGGGGGGDTPTPPTPEPTTTDAKVVTGASTTGVIDTTTAAVQNTLAGLLSLSADFGGKSLTPDIIAVNDYDYECPHGGHAYASGSVNISCAGEPSWSCTFTAGFEARFEGCMVSVTPVEGGIEYNETLGGSASIDVSSGSAGGTGEDLTSLSFSGTISGEPTVTGDVTGTANLSGISFQGSGVPPTVTCSGTASVTPDGEETQVCTISEDCFSCQL